VPIWPTLESKGLSIDCANLANLANLANSKVKSLYTVSETESRMGSEHKPTENGLQNPAAPFALATGPQAKAAAHQQADSTSSSYLLAGLQDVRGDILSLLTKSIEEMKSRNQTNGYRVGRGWLKSMTREPWEHLQYAADGLSNPQAGIDEILLGIQCLAYSDIVYRAQDLPWDEIHARYPAPPSRAIKPVVWPGPVEEDLYDMADDDDRECAMAAARLMMAEPTPAPAAKYPLPPAETTPEPVTPVVAQEAPVVETKVEIPAPVVEEPATVEPAAKYPIPPAKQAIKPMPEMHRRPGESQEDLDASNKLDREIAEILANNEARALRRTMNQETIQ
jgi:hypothetical protein